MIKLSCTYEIVTEESAEYGDAAERGYDWEDTDCTFKELVNYIQKDGFNIPSDSRGCPMWLSTESQQDYRTGEWESKSIHPGKDHQSQRYWEKACKYCGIWK